MRFDKTANEFGVSAHEERFAPRGASEGRGGGPEGQHAKKCSRAADEIFGIGFRSVIILQSPTYFPHWKATTGLELRISVEVDITNNPNNVHFRNYNY